MNVKMAQAMLLSLLIHLLLVLFWVLLQSKVKPKLPEMPIKKSELNLSDFRAYSPPQIAPQPAVATKTIQKQATKSTQKPKPIAKQVQKPTPKPKPITKQVQKPAPKPTQKPAPKPTKPQSSLASALMQQSTPVATQQPRDSKTERMIRSLYGAKFDTFTPAQKRFIKENLGKIHRITQNT
ncbi:MAG TPA: hypothetical protein ENN12_05800, partial [Epsilonproteobacteria bacterium]|nr:hypothetical protein [Campylobacterota bacterium]